MINTAYQYFSFELDTTVEGDLDSHTPCSTHTSDTENVSGDPQTTIIAVCACVCVHSLQSRGGHESEVLVHLYKWPTTSSPVKVRHTMNN